MESHPPDGSTELPPLFLIGSDAMATLHRACQVVAINGWREEQEPYDSHQCSNSEPSGDLT
jgi:hypothetical protein